MPREREAFCDNCGEKTTHHEVRMGMIGEVGWVCSQCGAENLLGGEASV